PASGRRGWPYPAAAVPSRCRAGGATVGQVAGGARGRLAGGARGRLAGGAGAPAVTEPGPSTPRAAMVGPPASMAPGRAAGATAGPPPGTAARAMVLTVAVRTGGGWSRRSVLAAGAAGAVGLQI